MEPAVGADEVEGGAADHDFAGVGLPAVVVGDDLFDHFSPVAQVLEQDVSGTCEAGTGDGRLDQDAGEDFVGMARTRGDEQSAGDGRRGRWCARR